MTEASAGEQRKTVRIAPVEQVSEQLSVARLSAALGMQNLRANVYTLAEGAMSEHMHRTQEELYIVLDGTAMIDVDGANHRVGPREAIAVPARAWRKVSNAGIGPLTFLCIAAPPADDDAEISPSEDPEEVRRLWGLVKN